MQPAMHSQVCAEAQRGTGTGFINKPNKGRCCQWPLRCGFGSARKADVYPEETNKAPSCQLGGESAQNSIIREQRRSDHVSEGRWPPRCIHTSIGDHQAAVCSNRRLSTFFFFIFFYHTYTYDWMHNCQATNQRRKKKSFINCLLLVNNVLACYRCHYTCAQVTRPRYWIFFSVSHDCPCDYCYLHTHNISLFHGSHVHAIAIKERCI